MLDYEEAKNIFNELYASIDGHEISTRARNKKGDYDKTLTYGEVTPETFNNILNKVNPKKGEVFYDLGSGTGKAVILASLLTDFSRLTGVEILPELRESAEGVLKNLTEKLKERFKIEKLDKEIRFINEDFLTYDFNDADVIFAHSTCFTEEMMKTLARKMDFLKKGTRVITVTKWLDSIEYKLIERKEYPFTWGNGTVSIYERI